MKVAIMQPYFFPYIGYFQLIHAVDIFVIYDDVNFIKQSWITRNNILVKNEAFRINLIVEGASSYKKINQISRIVENKKWLKTIEQSYRKAPFFSAVYPLVREIALNEEKSISRFLMMTLQRIAQYLDIQTTFKLSSELKKDDNLKAQDKVIAICKALNAIHYINATGGQNLYNKDDFNANQITLNFINTKPITYKQYDNQFIPWLSIIDVLMFNEKDEVKELLKQYELI
ncbi:WbqC family protein [Hyunsoonleella aestuarii]|uniref:WbqC family protein n=1 Tax=Hyunsoonleella aestuarii TaxID=912802 RepID=A0ABP8E769_9FLAO|nr:WbqC family protein [Hyunsoonleella aestuarii]